MSDDDLMASFKERLDKEGGATKFKLRTDAQRAMSGIKDGADSVAKGAQGLMGSVPVPKARVPQRDDLLDEGQWRTLLGFFGVVIVFSVITAVNSPKLDTYTSDGAPLEFGSRGYERQVYTPQLGYQ